MDTEAANKEHEDYLKRLAEVEALKARQADESDWYNGSHEDDFERLNPGGRN